MAGVREAGRTFRRRDAAPSRGDLREQALLDSLEALLAEHRIADISIDMIASGAGVKRPAFYVYFQTKYAALAVALARVRAIVEAADVFSDALSYPMRAADVRGAMRSLAVVWRDHADLLQAAIEASSQVAELDVVWTQWVEGFVDPVVSALPAERNAPAVARALVWANERCLYRAFRASRSDETVDEVADALSIIWISTLQAVDERG